MSIELKIFGTRGSIPRTEGDCDVFGGATSCYLIELPDRYVIFDAGSGLVELGAEIMKGPALKPIYLFFTHFHYDHMLGLPFFAPLFVKDWPVHVWYGEAFAQGALDAALDKLFSEPLCPITRSLLAAEITVTQVLQSKPLSLGKGLSLTTCSLVHPGGNTGYRLEHPGGVFVYSGDFEHGDAAGDRTLTEFLTGADVALLDCTYTPESYPACKGYGHAHWQAAGEIAAKAGVGQWYGVHHTHMAGDDVLTETEVALQKDFANGALARQGQVIPLAT